MISTATRIEDLTLNITQEIHVPASLDATFVNNLRYRLSEVDGGTLIKFHHAAFGLIIGEHRTGVNRGWTHMHDNVRKRAEAQRAH